MQWGTFMGNEKKPKSAKEIKAEVLSLFPVPFIIAYVFDIVYGFFYYRSFKQFRHSYHLDNSITYNYVLVKVKYVITDIKVRNYRYQST